LVERISNPALVSGVKLDGTTVRARIGDDSGHAAFVAGSLGIGADNAGAVTQATSKSTGVTLNKSAGQITMNNAALAAGVEVAFTLTNSAIAATDVLVVNVASGGTSAAYAAVVTAVAAGSAEITLSNLTAGSLSEAVVLNFAVIKGSVA
jgi:ribosomal protein S9